MAHQASHFRTVLALVLLGTLIPVLASLGSWQLRRATERDAVRMELARVAALAPLQLNANTPPAAMQAWRKASTHGRWLHDYSLLIGNRNLQGQPGYWVLTPLALDDGVTVLAVLRGWLAHDAVITQGRGGLAQRDGLADALARERDTVAVQGELFAHVPRSLELWSLSGAPDERLDWTPGTLPLVQNLELDTLSRAMGHALMPVVLAQENGTLTHDWPHPSVDADTNRGYALQWFSFCAIAAIAFAALAWRSLHSRSQEPQ